MFFEFLVFVIDPWVLFFLTVGVFGDSDIYAKLTIKIVSTIVERQRAFIDMYVGPVIVA